MTFKIYMRDLLPHKDECAEEDRPILNPITICRLITPLGWALFFSGWLAWTCDSFDFFCTSLSITALAEEFNKTPHDITLSITLTLLLRSVGAVVLGLLADRYGRKWPLVANLLVIAVLQLGTSFVSTFPQFLAVRSLFGLAMGGIWGLSAATALENAPVRTRGLLSGILQQGYAVGYLLAAVINLTLVADYTKKHGRGWRVLFWFGTGLSVLAAVVRAVLPESSAFIQAKADLRAAKARGEPVQSGRVFMRELGQMLKQHWLKCIHAVLLMTGFNFLSHGSQDLYPTYLQVSKGFSTHQSSIATIIGNCGAIAGGIVAGYISQFAGRRFTMLAFIAFLAAFIPLWILPNTFSGLSAGAFMMQFGVQGAWGVIPITLMELSPPAFRGTFPGVAYQLGNMVSSAASQIESTAGDKLRTTLNGKSIADYGRVQGILIGTVAAFTIIMILFIPERRGAHFEDKTFISNSAAHKTDADSVASQADVEKGRVETQEKV